MKRKRGYWPRSTKSKQGREGSRDGGVNRKKRTRRQRQSQCSGFLPNTGEKMWGEKMNERTGRVLMRKQDACLDFQKRSRVRLTRPGCILRRSEVRLASGR